MTSKTDATPSSDRELVLTRLIDAPRDKLFKAWTDPALLEAMVRAQTLHHAGRGDAMSARAARV